MRTSPLWSLLVRQAGIISSAQARRVGLTRGHWEYLIRQRTLLPVRPTVYRHAAVPPTPEGAFRAVSLWLGPSAAATTLSAAWWWGVTTELPSTWHFVIGRPTHLKAQPGVRVSRSWVDPGDLTSHRQVATISIPLAVRRGAAQLEGQQRGAGHALVTAALHRKLVTGPELALALRRNSGTWGTRAMRQLVDRISDRTHSELERLAVRLLRTAGITGYTINLRTVLSSGRPVELDLAFVEQRVAIELDGFAFHASPEAHQHDLRRQNDILTDGWTLRRFGWRDLIEAPEAFVTAVRDLIA